MEQTRAEVASLRRSVDSLSGAVEQLVSRDYLDSVQKEEERKRRNFGMLVIGVGASFVLIFMLMGLGLYQIAQYGEANRRNTELLVECTAPSTKGDVHECYERGMENQGKAIQAIVDKIAEEMRKQHAEQSR